MAVFFYSCSTIPKTSSTMGNKDFLETLLKSKPQQFSSILANRDSLRVQIIYTQINRDSKNNPSFTDYTFNLHNQYFYPASTVKMPIAFLALEKLNELNLAGVNKYTTMITDSAASRQDIVYINPQAIDSRPTIADYIKQIFLVSDNDAFNRLYEFLGQETIQKKLLEKGYTDAVIRHRLQINLSDEQNRATNPVSFYDTSGKLLYRQQARYNKDTFPTFDVKLGNGYLQGNELIHEPFDFSLKNKLNLQYLHDMEKSVLFPESVNEKQRFHLSEDDRNFLLHWMSAFPRESGYPSYDSAKYGDTYCKFLLWGSEKEISKPGYIRIFNKVGDAYGFVTDVAYIVDFEHKVEFMLAATISCNSDGIYNDDRYDYETVGYPFMKQLGQLLYEYELKRPKKHNAVLDDLAALQGQNK
jgi:hypothetical protein